MKVIKGKVDLLLNNWKETRYLTLELIGSISKKLLNKSLPRPGLNTLAKQILEMAEVGDVYVNAISSKRLDFSKVSDGSDVMGKVTKQELIKRLTYSERLFKKVLTKIINWDERVTLFGKRLPKYSILELMTRHETLHHGQFVAYGYLFDIKFPESWTTTWALPKTKHIQK